MTVGMAIIFFPLYALWSSVTTAFNFNMRFHQQEVNQQINQEFVEPKMEKK
jgi:hypothetical protein